MADVRLSLPAILMLLLAGCATGSPEKTRAHFEECKEQSGYKTAVLTEVNPDGSFLYKGDDPAANNALKACLSGKGHSMSTARQAKAEADFIACTNELGARGAVLTYVGPNGEFKWRPGTGGSVSIAQAKPMMDCMRAKGYRFYDGPTPR